MKLRPMAMPKKTRKKRATELRVILLRLGGERCARDNGGVEGAHGNGLEVTIGRRLAEAI
jgi:hypothetical protein